MATARSYRSVVSCSCFIIYSGGKGREKKTPRPHNHKKRQKNRSPHSETHALSTVPCARYVSTLCAMTNAVLSHKLCVMCVCLFCGLLWGARTGHSAQDHSLTHASRYAVGHGTRLTHVTRGQGPIGRCKLCVHVCTQHRLRVRHRAHITTTRRASRNGPAAA